MHTIEYNFIFKDTNDFTFDSGNLAERAVAAVEAYGKKLPPGQYVKPATLNESRLPDIVVTVTLRSDVDRWSGDILGAECRSRALTIIN